MMPIPATPDLYDGPAHDPRGLGGLVALAERAELPLPLREVRVRARVAGDCCVTTIEQRFGNPLDAPAEAVHICPLPEDGAVTGVELVCGAMTVRAECRERQEAEARFDAARRVGHRAALLTRERDDVHTLRVTNLPPGEEVTVRIELVQRLEAQDGRLIWRFPTTLAPRYTPGTPVGHSGPGVAPDTDQAPDASRLSPPLRLEGGTALDLEVFVEGPVRALASSLHAMRLDLEGGGVRVAPSGKTTLDRDFILAFATGDAERCAGRAWTDGRHTLVLVEPPTDRFPEALPRDVVFVIDVSGSMDGRKMEAARLALTTALRGLVEGDRFRLIAFNTRHHTFAPEFTDFSQRNLERAEGWVRALRPGGGTEMLAPIQAALDGETPPGRIRTVLFITDGQAHNDGPLVAAVANRRRGARFFTLGIDTAVNAALLKRLARVGGGTCDLCTPSDDIEAIVARLEARVGSPLLSELQADGEGGVLAARPEGQVLFSGKPAAILLEGAPTTVSLTGRSAEGAWQQQLTPRQASLSLGALWARERVAWLEDRLAVRPFEEEAIVPEIRRIALAHGIASRATAFVAVETSRIVGDGDPTVIVQPAELPHQWTPQGGGGAFAGAAPPPPAMRPAPGAPPPSPVLHRRARRAPMREKLEDAWNAPTTSPPMTEGSKKGRAAGAGLSQALFEVAFEEEDSEASFADGSVAGATPASPAARRAVDTSALAQRLAASQDADGSFGGDVARTAAALLALVLFGHTRRKGLRRRAVLKAASWLEAHRSRPEAAAALEALAAAEAGHRPQPTGAWAALRAAGPEGEVLRQAEDS
ncbi:MAG: VWA domain-containing protein [Alphaproteobacteria bacterium]|nr:VWA domain-containing protein [Alphaproteobacteria bacterium]